MTDDVLPPFVALDSDVIEFVAPHGHALLRVVIVPSCAEADRLRAITRGPVLFGCRCAVARLLLEASRAHDAADAQLACMLFNGASEVSQ